MNRTLDRLVRRWETAAARYNRDCNTRQAKPGDPARNQLRMVAERAFARMMTELKSVLANAECQRSRSAWGALWRSSNRLDGTSRHLLYEHGVIKLFVTRAAARQWIEEQYGYIRRRDDLKHEPHGWQMPVAVRVCITQNAKLTDAGGKTRKD